MFQTGIQLYKHTYIYNIEYNLISSRSHPVKLVSPCTMQTLTPTHTHTHTHTHKHTQALYSYTNTHTMHTTHLLSPLQARTSYQVSPPLPPSLEAIQISTSCISATPSPPPPTSDLSWLLSLFPLPMCMFCGRVTGGRKICLTLGGLNAKRRARGVGEARRGNVKRLDKCVHTHFTSS